MLIADGRPKKNPKAATRDTDFFRVIPVSINIRVINSIIEMREEKAAKVRAKKNRARKKEPAGTFAKSFGIQMNVNP
jgi:hypothetical protein